MKNIGSKRIIATILTVIMIVMMVPIYSITAHAEEIFFINTKFYTESEIKNIQYSSCYSLCGYNVGTKGHVCCVKKSKEAYKYFWGQECNNNFKRDDLLYGKSDIPITTENIEKYLKAADPGAIVYFVKSNDKSYGHAFLLLKVNSTGTGAWILNCNYDNRGNCAVQQLTWSEIVDLKNYSGANVLYYIQFPNGASYQDRLNKNTIQIKLDELAEIFPNESYFTVDGNPSSGSGADECYYPSVAKAKGFDWSNMWGAWSCCGYAHFAFRYIFGNEFTWDKAAETASISTVNTENLNKLFAECKTGDIIELTYNNVKYEGSHWFMFIGYTAGSNVIVNTCNTAGECMVYLNKSWSYNFFLNNVTAIKKYHASNYDSLGGGDVASVNYSDILTDTYYLKNASTGKYLTIDAKSNTSNISVADFKGDEMQKFILGNAIGNTYMLSTTYDSSLHINPYWDSKNPYGAGTNITLHSKESDNDQHWGFEAVSDGYILHNMKNDIYVIGLDGNNAQLETNTGEDDQIWILEPVNPLVYFNVNGKIDGVEADPLGDYVKFDLYLDGELIGAGIGDYYRKVPVGTEYEVTNVQPAEGYSYAGMQYGSLKGTVSEDGTAICFKLLSTPLVYFDVNGIINGEKALPLYNYVTFDVYLNGELEGSAVGDFYEEVPVGTEYEIKNIQALDGYSYDGVYSGSLTGTVGDEETIVCLALSELEKPVEPKETEPEETEPDEPSKIIKGDVNSDGEINNKDVVMLFRYVSHDNKDEDESIYDFYDDGEINNKDVIALFRYVSIGENTSTTDEVKDSKFEDITGYDKCYLGVLLNFGKNWDERLMEWDIDPVNLTGAYYCLRDINDDGVNELIIGREVDYIDAIYTRTGNEVVCIYFREHHGSMGITSDGYIYSSYKWIYMYKLENAELIQIYNIYANSDLGDDKYEDLENRDFEEREKRGISKTDMVLEYKYYTFDS